ncbi:MAG: AMP-binding protein [Saccharofermentans sp.]|nr:AMP-binding protein [Saccharofermentans sp.]
MATENFKTYNTIKDIVLDAVSMYSGDVAFRVKTKAGKNPEYKDYTYTEFKENLDAMGTALYDAGLQGKRMAIIGRNQYHYVVTHVACLMGGIVSVPIDKELPLQEMEDSLVRAEVDAIMFDVKYVDAINEIKAKGKTSIKNYYCMNDSEAGFTSAEELISRGRSLIAEGKREFIDFEADPASMAILLFTSGTTSKSKAVMLSNHGLAVNVSDLLYTEVFEEHSTNIAFLPYHHILGGTGMIFAIGDGMRTVFSDGIRYIKQNLSEYNVTFFLGVPALIDKMYDQVEKGIEKQGKTKAVAFAKKLSKFLLFFHIDIRRKLFKDVIKQLGGELRYIISGGAPLSARVASGFHDLGIEIYQGYGLTETSPVLVAENYQHSKPGTIGVALPHVTAEMKDLDENGIGELCVKAPNVMIGYYKNPELTAEVIDSDGWFHTGDLGFMDKQGYITLTGRKKDMIVLKNGKKAFPEEIEMLLLAIPGVIDAFVYGEPIDGDVTDPKVACEIQYDLKSCLEAYGELANDESALRETIWNAIKEVNTTLPHYKRVTELYLTTDAFIKTTSLKTKRKEELAKVLKAKGLA